LISKDNQPQKVPKEELLWTKTNMIGSFSMQDIHIDTTEPTSWSNFMIGLSHLQHPVSNSLPTTMHYTSEETHLMLISQVKLETSWCLSVMEHTEFKTLKT